MHNLMQSQNLCDGDGGDGGVRVCVCERFGWMGGGVGGLGSQSGKGRKVKNFEAISERRSGR